ncbi:MAG TPA: flavin reductase family protein [Balneolales bacterium]|nr:flavin reductase family protein [Balneolales bacterium]
MDIDLSSVEPTNRYKLLSSIIIPRPIAWITTINKEGHVNAAPYSYFNIMGTDPPVVAVGPQYRYDFREGLKDTPRNIRENGTFVINIVNEALAQKMDQTSGHYPCSVNELEEVDLDTAESVEIEAPRILQSPVSIECREHTTLFIGNTRVILGIALHLHINDDLIDQEHFYVDMEALKAVGRMGGGRYITTRDMFDF